MSDIPSFRSRSYEVSVSWASVANLTRRDGEEFFALAPKVPVRATAEAFRLGRANEALASLRAGRIKGAAGAGAWRVMGDG